MKKTGIQIKPQNKGLLHKDLNIKIGDKAQEKPLAKSTHVKGRSDRGVENKKGVSL